jgi:4-amino-4-deoxy-L-arabinose transferase-like glycosyltransferase
MSSLPQTATPQAPPSAGAAESGASRWRARVPAVLSLAPYAGFVAVVAFSAVLNTYRLSQNGYSNIFYSAGVKSMLRSLHNFVFVSFDPAGLISVDKPPLGLWAQAASAKLFGFSPLSLLLPEAIFGVLTVAVLYVVLVRRVGTAAAFASAFALAVFPSFVAVSRDNGVDPLLILLMTLAAAAGLRAAETGRWRWLMTSAVLVGLAFNVKTLAAYLVLPGIAAAFALCAPRPPLDRALKLVVAAIVTVLVSFAWIAFVELVPAGKRPYAGSSTNNTQLGLTFQYNGFGRVEGQVGGPHDVHVRAGARVPPVHHHHSPRELPGAGSPGAPPPAGTRGAAALPSVASGHNPTFLANGRYRNPIPFGSRPSPVRLWGKGLGDQDGWTIPFALFGTIALGVIAVARSRRRRLGSGGDSDRPADASATGGPDFARRGSLTALTLVWGGWFLVEALVLSASKGIVHPYYASALAPATGAMAGVGAVAIVWLRTRARSQPPAGNASVDGYEPEPAGATLPGQDGGSRTRERPGSLVLWGLALAALAILGTLGVQIVLLHREQYLLWLIPVLIAGCGLALGLLAAVRALTGSAMAVAFSLLLIAPTAYATTTWLAPVEGTFPAAGPKSAAGAGGFGVSPKTIAIDRALARYVLAHRPGSRWALLTVASDQAAPLILMGLDAGALGGYSGTDPAVDGPKLAGMVRRGEARYVLLGGEYSTRGGNKATDAVLRACKQLTAQQWHSPDPYPNGLTLFDCAGVEARLARA